MGEKKMKDWESCRSSSISLSEEVVVIKPGEEEVEAKEGKNVGQTKIFDQTEHEQTDGNRYENNGHDRQTSPSNNPEFQEGYILPSTCNYLRLLDEDFQEITYDQIPANSGGSPTRLNFSDKWLATRIETGRTVGRYLFSSNLSIMDKTTRALPAVPHERAVRKPTEEMDKTTRALPAVPHERAVRKPTEEDETKDMEKSGKKRILNRTVKCWALLVTALLLTSEFAIIIYLLTKGYGTNQKDGDKSKDSNNNSLRSLEGNQLKNSNIGLSKNLERVAMVSNNHSNFGEWSQWSSCSDTCKIGLRNRARECKDGHKCFGQLEQVEKCLTKDIHANLPGSKWHLGMNLNPSDGHIMDYLTGWEEGNDIGNYEEALAKDYINNTIWNMPVTHIAIVRHQKGFTEAVKVWEFKERGKSMLARFRANFPGREVVTKGGPRQVFMVRNITNNVDDPIFSIPGDIAMNWNYYNNRHRIVLTGGHLSANDSNDENTHGFGNHVCVERKGKSRDQCKFEISNIQDCPFPSCRNVKVQGTDHGSDYKDGPVYGNYAIYLSNNTQRFPTCRRMLMLQMNDDCS